MDDEYYEAYDGDLSALIEDDGYITPERYLDYPINTNECAE